MQHIAKIARPEVYQSAEFASFEQFVKEWLVFQNLAKTELVFRTQCSYICDASGASLVSKVCKLEQESDIVGYLEDILKRRIFLQKLNASSVNIYDYRKAYDASTRDLVADIYKGDIAAFGYDF